MKTSIEVLEGLKRSITVEMPFAVLAEKTDKIIRDIAKKANINGFRQGKIPLSVSRKMFGNKAKADAANEIIQETLKDALAKHKLSPAAQPLVTKINLEEGKDFFYNVEFEVYPEIKVNSFENLKIEQTKVKVSKEDENTMLENVKQQLTEYKKVKRKSKVGDKVIIDFKGFIDGNEFEGGHADDFEIIIGEHKMIEGFEEGLTAVEENSDLTLNLKFPKNYHSKDLMDKDVVFNVKVKEVLMPKTPKIDDSFAKKVGLKNTEDLHKNIKEQIKTKADNAVLHENKESVFNALLEDNVFEVPKASIERESQNMLEEMQANLKKDTNNKRKFQTSDFNIEAEKRVKLMLLINKITEDNKLKVDEKQVDDKLQEMSKSYGENGQKMIDYYKSNPSNMAHIESLLIEDMVEKLILDKAVVNYNVKKFQEIMQGKG
jgi:trigger factor